MTDLLLARHGQATHNLEQRWVGWGATPLTGEGQRQARALARRLAGWVPRVQGLYTSPLLRARQTAEPIAAAVGLDAAVHDGLREINFGEVSGLTREEFRSTMPELYVRWQRRDDLEFSFPGGEQRLSFWRRVAAALDEIAARHPHGTVAVVAHGGTLRAGLACLFPETMSDWWAYDLGNGSLTHVRLGEGAPLLVRLNDCDHLGDGHHAGE